jgi:hypothetical protein
MIVPPTDEKTPKGKSPLQALCRLFLLSDRSGKKLSKSTTEEVLPAMNAEWVKSEGCKGPKGPKLTPKDTLKTYWKRKSFFPSVFERQVYPSKCPCCSNEIQKYFHQRDGALFNKYVDQSAGKQGTRIPTDYDTKKWNSMGYTQTLGQGEKYDTCYKKHLMTLYCQKCGKAVTDEYLVVYLQEKTRGFKTYSWGEYVKEKN